MVSVDISPLAIEACKSRGLGSAHVLFITPLTSAGGAREESLPGALITTQTFANSLNISAGNH